MLLYILRHGVTEWNRLKKVQGRADIPLAEAGERLAKMTGAAVEDIPFDICYSSPLIRARRTAELVLEKRESKVPVILDKRLAEIDFGVLEGERFKDEEGNILSREMLTFFDDPMNFERPKDGENIQDVVRRTGAFYRGIIHDATLQDKHILIASHGCAVRALLQNIDPCPGDFWRGCVPPNCSMTIVEVRGCAPRILALDKVFA